MKPFNKKDCQQALDSSGRYICAMPFSWLNLQYSPMPGVQLSRAHVQLAINDDNCTFDVFPMQKVAITTGENDFTDLTCISPEETRIAKVANFVRRHKQGEITNEQVWQFRRNIWCIPTTI